MEKRERTAKSRQENDILDRVLLWFGASVIFELFLLLVNRYYFNYRVSEIGFAQVLDHIIPVIAYIGVAGMAASIVWALVGRKNKRKTLPITVAAFSAAVSLCCILVRTYGAVSIQVLQIMVLVAAVLALVYYLYQKEFFVITLMSGLCIFGLWLYRRAFDGHAALCFGYMGAFAVFVVAVILLAQMLQRKEGVLTLRGRQYRFLQRNTSYSMIYATCALMALAIIATLTLGVTAAYYIIFLLVAWIFAMAVFYTVRLM